MTPPTIRSALFAFALGALTLASACAEDESFDGGNGDTNDNFLGVHDDVLGFSERSYEFVGTPFSIGRKNNVGLVVEPVIEINEEQNTFLTKTAEIHHKYIDPIEFFVYDGDYTSLDPEASSDDDRFGMQLEVLWHDRENDETEWIKMNIGDFDNTYAWKSLKVKRIANDDPEKLTSIYKFTGVVAQYADGGAFSDPIESFHTDESVIATGHSLEFRIAVVPLYSEYNWERSHTWGFGLKALLEARCFIGSRGRCEYDGE